MTAAAEHWLATAHRLNASDTDFSTTLYGDIQAAPDIEEDDVLHVVGGTLWYSYSDSCTPSGCCLDTDCNGGALIAGTEAIPWDVPQYFVENEYDTDLIAWVAAGGIYDACNGDGWLTLAAGTTVTVTATNINSFAPGPDDMPPSIGRTEFDVSYAGGALGMIGGIFGFATDPIAFASFVSHVRLQNERTGEIYNIIVYQNSCF